MCHSPPSAWHPPSAALCCDANQGDKAASNPHRTYTCLREQQPEVDKTWLLPQGVYSLRGGEVHAKETQWGEWGAEPDNE